MAGTIVADTLQDGAGNSTAMDNAIKGSAKAWCQFTGGNPCTIRNSFNISSITYNSTGVYTVNFTTAMPNANYSALYLANFDSTSNTLMGSKVATYTTTSCQLACYSSGTVNFYDVPNNNFVVFSS